MVAPSARHRDQGRISVVLHLIMVGAADCDAVIRKARPLAEMSHRVNAEPVESFLWLTICSCAKTGPMI
jgi:hypothetical protein